VNWFLASVALFGAAPTLSDDWVYEVSGKYYILSGKITSRLLDDASIRRRFAGEEFENSCAAFWIARRGLSPSYEQAFKPLMIAAVRKVVPPERLAQAKGPATNADRALLPYDGRVSDELDRTAATIFAEASRELRVRFETEAAHKRNLPKAPDAYREASKEGAAHAMLACTFYFNEHHDQILPTDAGENK